MQYITGKLEQNFKKKYTQGKARAIYHFEHLLYPSIECALFDIMMNKLLQMSKTHFQTFKNITLWCQS